MDTYTCMHVCMRNDICMHCMHICYMSVYTYAYITDSREDICSFESANKSQAGKITT